MSLPYTANLTVYRGDVFTFPTINVTDSGTQRSVTSATAQLHIRESADAATTTIELDQTSGITLQATDPTISAGLTAAQTATLTRGKIYVYDLSVTFDGLGPQTYIRGTLAAIGDVSR